MRSCCLPPFFLERAYCAFKNEARKREVRSPANFVQYLPPLPIGRASSPLVRFPCIDLRDAAAGEKTCSCRCIAQFLPWVFFAANLCLRARTMHKKNISVASRPSAHPPPPSKPDNTPPPPTPPFPQQPTKARVGPVLSQGSWGRAALPFFAARVR